jgi:type IV secretory pathway VirB4 component
VGTTVDKKKMKEDIRAVSVGIGDRKEIKKQIKMANDAVSHIFIEAVADQKAGIFYTSKGDLVAVIRLDSVSKVGLSEDNLIANSHRVAAVMNRLPPNICVHSWQDCSPEALDPLPTDYYNDFLAAVEEQRNEFLAGRLLWRTENYLALEWRGLDFAQGGPVTVEDAVKSAVNYVKASMAKEAKVAARAKYKALSYFNKDLQIVRIYEESLEAEVMAFKQAIDEFIDNLCSEQAGVGAYLEMGSLVEQIGTQPKVLMKATLLNADDAYKALYSLGDPDPWRRKNARMGDGFDLPYKLGAETVDFVYLLSIAQNPRYDVKNESLREIGEHGPYTVGGIPRQVFAIRSLPLSINYDIFAGLRALGVPFTARVRWSRLTDKASRSWLEDRLNRKRWNSTPEEFAKAKVEAERVLGGISEGFFGMGLGTILISLNGTPHLGHGSREGRMLNGTEVLLESIRKFRRWCADNDIIADSLSQPNDQGNAHYAMYPGAWHLDPLEEIPIRALTMGKILPLYASEPPMPQITAYPGIPILTLESATGAVCRRGLEVGEVGLGAICGASGSGKSYTMADIVVNFLKNQGRYSLGEKNDITIDTFEFGDGTDAGSSFNSTIRLIGGKVIQFGEKGSDHCLNPWDIDVPNGPDGQPIGYSASTLEFLTDLMVTMGGGMANCGGPVTPAIRECFMVANQTLGKTPTENLFNNVRCFSNAFRWISDNDAKMLLNKWADPEGLGAFFPAEPDASKAMAVNYNFSLEMSPSIRTVLFTAVLTRMAQRAYSSDAKIKLMMGDEIGAGLAKGQTKEEESITESARAMLSKLFANARRFGGRCFLAFQRPSQILSMGDTLANALRGGSSTFILYQMSEDEEAKELFKLTPQGMRLVRNLEKRQFVMVQGGQFTVAKIVNPPLAHAAATTAVAEKALRDAMISTGRFGKGKDLELYRLVSAFSSHLGEVAKPNSKVTLESLTRDYKAIAKEVANA